MEQQAVLEGGFEFGLFGDGPLLAITGEVEALFGIGEAEFQSGRVRLLDRIHSHDRERFSRVLSGLEDLGAGSMNLRLRHRDGGIRCVRASYIRAATEKGAVVRISLQDAKSLWQARGTSADSVFYQAFLENSMERIFFKDANHVFIGASKGFKEFSRRWNGLASVEGLVSYDFLPEEQADAIHEFTDEVMNEATEKERILDVTGSGSEASWVWVRSFPVFTACGMVAGFVGISRDVTASFRTSETLSETDQSLLLAGIGSCLLDIRRGVWTSSQFLESVFGIPHLGQHRVEEWTGILHPEDRDSVWKYFENACRSGEPFDLEYRIVRPIDGKVRWVHGLTKFDLDRDGQPILMRGVIRDITDRRENETALRETEERLRIFIEHAPAALAMFDSEMCYLEVSRQWREMFHVDRDEVLGKSHYEMFPDLPKHLRESNDRTLSGIPQRNDDEQLVVADGTVLHYRWESHPWLRSDRSVGGMVLFVEDLREVKEAERRLLLAASIFEHSNEGIVVTDLDGNIVEVNDAFSRVTGYSREEAIGKNPRILKSGMQTAEFYQEMWNAIKEKGRWRGELWNRARDGAVFVVSSTITTVLDTDGRPQYYVSLFYDVTPVKEQERKLEQISRFDALTGLPNRALLSERLRTAMAECRQSQEELTLVMFDLDAFKEINDAHGREAADSLLIAIGARMKHALRDGDTLARMGGDEFAAVLRGIQSRETACLIIDRLMASAAQPVVLRDRVVRATATAGATFYPQSEDVDADQLMRQADRAMYEAKLAGKNSYKVFDPQSDNSVRGRNEEIEQIRQALAQRQFLLHYQPRVNMATGELVGVEALLRWQHPQRGLLPPGFFLPNIEKHELMLELGAWILEEAINQASVWKARGMTLTVSVNLSAKQLEQRDFVEQIRALLQRYPDVPPSMLELEILETSALEDLAGVSAVIKACRDLGIAWALDDFGTGYSSLTYLKRLPAAVLKIDQSFVRDMLEDPDDLAIVQGVLSLAAAFHRTAVAEGVERVEHGRLLLQLGCQQAQGYGIARPMPAEEIEGWHEKWRPHPSWHGVQPMSPLLWPILVAAEEARSWNEEFVEFMRGQRTSCPELDENKCRFGAWLEREKLNPRGSIDSLAKVFKLHLEAHRIARRAVKCKLTGHADDATGLLKETLDTRERMMELLQDTFRNQGDTRD